MLLIIIGVILQVAFTTLLERKFMGAIQRRSGPNQIGYLGLIQPLIDGVKLILKENIIPRESMNSLFLFAPFLTFYLALLNWLFIPLTYTSFITEIPSMGILVLIAISELAIFGVFYAGWSGNSKYPLIGGIRSTSQMISYAISLSLVILAVLIIIGDTSLMKIIYSTTNQFRILILFPYLFLFPILVLAETNRAPFDLPEAESELVAGFFTEYSGLGFVFFFLAEYTSILTLSVLFSLLFFATPHFFFTSFLFLFVLWIRAVLPRLRFDQLLALGWVYFIPFTISFTALFLPSLLFILI